MNKEQIRHLLILIEPIVGRYDPDSVSNHAEMDHKLSLAVAILQSHLLGESMPGVRTEEWPWNESPGYPEPRPFTYNDFKLTCDMVNEAAGLATARSGNNEDND